MKKKDKIYDSPEYKQIREHLPEILKEMERDKGLKQYQMPEGWNEDFERIYQAEHRKERIRNRILAGACAAIILGIGAVHVGERLELTSMVQADDIGKTTENGFEDGNYQYSVNGNVEEDNNSLIIDDSEEITFEESDLQTLYENLKTETKAPLFYFTNIDNNSEVSYAVYNKAHRAISYRVLAGENYVYISQAKQVEETSNGGVNEKKLVQEVEISKLNMKTEVYESTQDNSLYCNFIYDNNTVTVISDIDLESYIAILQGIEYH